MKFFRTLLIIVCLTTAIFSQNLNLEGYQLIQYNSSNTVTFAAGTEIEPNGYLILGRDCTQSEFETFWSVTLPSNCTYVNAADITGSISLNGAEYFDLLDGTSATIDTSSGLPLVGSDAVQRNNPGNDGTQASSWTAVVDTAANPGSGVGTSSGAGLVINEISDASGTGNYIYEFVELYYDFSLTPQPTNTLAPTLTSTNTFNTFTPVPQPDILINEFQTRGSSSAYDEFVELYNYGSTVIDLDGWYLYFRTDAGFGGVQRTLYQFQPGDTINPGSYLLVVNSDGMYASYSTYQYSGTGLTSGGIALCSNVDDSNPNNIVDSLAYGGASGDHPYIEGAKIPGTPFDDLSASRCPNATDSNDNSNDFWLDTEVTISDTLGGQINNCTVPNTKTPTATYNTFTPTETFPTYTPSATATYFNPNLVINEVKTGGFSGYDEFIEIYNNESFPVNLSQADVRLYYCSSTCGGSYTEKFAFSTASPDAIINPGGYITIAYDGGLYGTSADYNYTGSGISGTSGGLAIYVGDGNISGTLVDSLAYGNTTADPHPFNEGGSGFNATTHSSSGSLIRNPNGQDTDVNSTDFIETSSITLGSENIYLPYPTNTPFNTFTPVPTFDTYTPTATFDTHTPTATFETYTPSPEPTFFIPNLVINEVKTGGVSGYDEFIEIYNKESFSVNLTQADIRLYYCSSTCGGSYTEKFVFSTASPDAIINPGGYITIAYDGGFYGTSADYNYTGSGISGTSGGLAIYVGDGNVSGTLVDSLAYGYTSADPHPFNEGGSGFNAVRHNSEGSLIRNPNGQDTDVNSNDFIDTSSITFGSENIYLPYPTSTPTATYNTYTPTATYDTYTPTATYDTYTPTVTFTQGTPDPTFTQGTPEPTETMGTPEATNTPMDPTQTPPPGISTTNSNTNSLTIILITLIFSIFIIKSVFTIKNK